MQSDLLVFQQLFAAKLLTGAPSEFDRLPGFAIYRNTSAAATIDALAAGYSIARTILGDIAFRGLALEYFRRDPPKSAVLAEYGAGFADWLEQQPKVENLPYLADVARIDRSQLEAHLAGDPDDPPELHPSDIAEDEWMMISAELHPATRFHWFDTPAPSIWLALRQPSPPDEIAPIWQPEGILLTRIGGAVEASHIDHAEHRLLSGIIMGESVGEAAIAAARIFPQWDVGAAFRHLFESGAIHRFQRKDERQ
jgi:hypothetical protein